MQKPSRWLIASLCVFMVVAQPVLAWNKAGHMLTAAVAFHVLKAEHPATIAKVVTLLKEHPHYEEKWADRLASVADDQKDEYLFMLAARWPDDIRGNEAFDMERWHYVNYPFKPAGQPDSVETAPPAWENLIRAYELNKAAIGESEDQEERAISLCWLFHLTGDVHQPLHVATLFTTDFLQGDRGGTRFFVRSRGTTVSLHKFWDDAAMRSERFRSVHNRAVGFVARDEFQRTQLSELSAASFEHWAQVESLKLAKEVAYDQGHLAGSPEESSAPALPDTYAGKVAPVAERRVALAGYRLADTLRNLFD